MSKIGIVIVHYNSEKETRGCLESLKKLEHGKHEVSVIVVDNGSKEPLTIAEDHLPPHTTILRSDANLGFTSGNNLGIKHFLREPELGYVLLLNNDTEVDPDLVLRLLECAQSQEHVGMVAPKIYFSPKHEFHQQSYTKDQLGKVLWYAGGSIDWPQLEAFHRGVDEVDRGQFDAVTDTEFVTGCCVLIPRAVLEEVGLFDPKYFLYLEDVDLSWRIRRAGYRLVFCPDAVVWHLNAGSSGGAGSLLHQYYQTRNRLFFFGKFAPLRTQLTVLRFALRLLIAGKPGESTATLDWLLGRMGKQRV